METVIWNHRIAEVIFLFDFFFFSLLPLTGRRRYWLLDVVDVAVVGVFVVVRITLRKCEKRTKAVENTKKNGQKYWAWTCVLLVCVHRANTKIRKTFNVWKQYDGTLNRTESNRWTLLLRAARTMDTCCVYDSDGICVEYAARVVRWCSTLYDASVYISSNEANIYENEWETGTGTTARASRWAVCCTLCEPAIHYPKCILFRIKTKKQEQNFVCETVNDGRRTGNRLDVWPNMRFSVSFNSPNVNDGFKLF